MKPNRFTRDVQTGEGTVRAINDHFALLPRHHAVLANSLVQKNLDLNVRLTEEEDKLHQLITHVKRTNADVDDSNQLIFLINTTCLSSISRGSSMIDQVISQSQTQKLK